MQLQLIGLGVQVINRMAGNFYCFFICSAGIILYAVKLDIEQRKFKICPKCKDENTEKNTYLSGMRISVRTIRKRRGELTDMIEHRRDEEEAYKWIGLIVILKRLRK